MVQQRSSKYHVILSLPENNAFTDSTLLPFLLSRLLSHIILTFTLIFTYKNSNLLAMFYNSCNIECFHFGFSFQRAKRNTAMSGGPKVFTGNWELLHTFPRFLIFVHTPSIYPFGCFSYFVTHKTHNFLMGFYFI